MSYRALNLSEVCALLRQKQPTLIVYHSRPDADAIGSAQALRALLLAMDVPAACAGSDPVPDRLHFLEDPTATDPMFLPTRVISVDSASPSQLGSLFEQVQDQLCLMIDHHASGTVYADHYIRPEAAATGEILYEIACELLRTGAISQIPRRVYGDLYTAISSDTGCFRYANVTPSTLRCVACLLESGEVDAAMVNHCLFESKTVKQVRAEGEAARSLRLYDGGSIASVVIPYELKASLELTDQNLETAIDIPRSIQGVKIAFAVRQSTAEGFFRVSMRSNTDFDVSAVCARFGGGGHHRAAGCGLTASDVRDAEAQILAVIRAMRNQV